MQYAYVCKDPRVGNAAIVGSCVRGVGKSWNVKVVSKNSSFWNEFRMRLNSPEKFVVENPEHWKELTHKSQYHLVLLDNTINQDHISIIKKNCAQIKSHCMVSSFNPVPSSDYDLISESITQKLNPGGVMAFTGTGKGKTTSSIGIAWQNLLQNPKDTRPIAVVQWFKEKKQGNLTWAINEHFFPEKLKTTSSIEFHCTGLGFFGSPNLDRVKGNEAYLQHRKNAYDGIKLAKEKISSGLYQAVILDEFVDTVKEVSLNIPLSLVDLVDMQEMLRFCTDKDHGCEVIVTGRRVTPEWSNFVQLSIVISEIKHPWATKQQPAISGLDF